MPNQAVRDHAVKIAQVHSATPVVDSMKEHPSLLVRPGQMSPQQLQNSAQSSLRVVLPKQYQQLKVDVSGDGKVFVAGPVNSYEEKLAVSHSLRRLHGCTSVQNLTLLPLEVAKASPSFPSIDRGPPTFPPIITTSNQPVPRSDKPPVKEEPKSKPWQWPVGKGPATTKEEPPLLDTKKPAVVDTKKPNPLGAPVVAGPEVMPPVPTNPEVVKEDTPVPGSRRRRPCRRRSCKSRVKAAWPSAKSVTVDFTSASELRMVLEIRDEKELTVAAERIFALPELNDARVDLQFKISGQ